MFSFHSADQWSNAVVTSKAVAAARHIIIRLVRHYVVGLYIYIAFHNYDAQQTTMVTNKRNSFTHVQSTIFTAPPSLTTWFTNEQYALVVYLCTLSNHFKWCCEFDTRLERLNLITVLYIGNVWLKSHFTSYAIFISTMPQMYVINQSINQLLY